MARYKVDADTILSITLLKSIFGRTPVQRACVKALGLRKIRHVVRHPARPEIIGLLHKIGFLLHVEEVKL